MTENLISLKYNCHNTNIIVLKVDKHSFKLKHFKHSFLVDFFNDLEKGTRVKTQKGKNKREKKTNVYNTALELYNEMLGIFLMR